MSIRRPFVAPIALLALSIAVTGCGGASAPSTAAAASVPAAATTPASDPAALAAYSAAMCPIFEAIVRIDPRLADLRSAAADGDDLAAEAAEISAVADELLAVLTDLERVPEWGPGAELRFHLIVALHQIRTTLLRVARDPTVDAAREDLADLRLIASATVDQAMTAASDAGLSCASS